MDSEVNMGSRVCVLLGATQTCPLRSNTFPYRMGQSRSAHGGSCPSRAVASHTECCRAAARAAAFACPEKYFSMQNGAEPPRARRLVPLPSSSVPRRMLRGRRARGGSCVSRGVVCVMQNCAEPPRARRLLPLPDKNCPRRMLQSRRAGGGSCLSRVVVFHAEGGRAAARAAARASPK